MVMRRFIIPAVAAAAIAFAAPQAKAQFIGGYPSYYGGYGTGLQIGNGGLLRLGLGLALGANGYGGYGYYPGYYGGYGYSYYPSYYGGWGGYGYRSYGYPSYYRGGYGYRHHGHHGRRHW
jgi:hypothetical protein